MKHAELKIFKKEGQKITCLTAYDASIASLIDNSGVDIILIGDSLGMVIQGSSNTQSVLMSDMSYHTEIVSKACNQALIIADMPFESYNNADSAVANAKQLIAKGADMVKIEGGSEHLKVINALISENINVCGHLGLQPQLIVDSSGYKIQGRDNKSAMKILSDSVLLESRGVSALVLECIPGNLARKISEKLIIPTIGIGAGVDCDGQVLVSYDMLGITSGKQPRFVRNFMNSEGTVAKAVSAFVREVKEGTFPSESESY